MVILQEDEEDDYISSSSSEEEEDDEDDFIIMDHRQQQDPQNPQQPPQNNHHPVNRNLKHLMSSTKFHQLRMLVERCIADMNKESNNSNTIPSLSTLFGSANHINIASVKQQATAAVVGVSPTATFPEVKTELRLQKVDNYVLKQLIAYQLQLVNVQTTEIEKREDKNFRLVERVKKLKRSLAQSRGVVARLKSNQRLIGTHEQGSQTSLQFPLSTSVTVTPLPSTSSYSVPLPVLPVQSCSSRVTDDDNSASTSRNTSQREPDHGSSSPRLRRRESNDDEESSKSARSRSHCSSPKFDNHGVGGSKRRRSSVSSNDANESESESGSAPPSRHSSPKRTASPRALRKRTDTPLYFPPPAIRRPSFSSGSGSSNANQIVDSVKDVSSPNTSTSPSPSTSMFNTSFFANLGKKTTPIIVTNYKPISSSIGTASETCKKAGTSTSNLETTASTKMDMKSKCVEISQRATVHLKRADPFKHKLLGPPSASSSKAGSGKGREEIEKSKERKISQSKTSPFQKSVSPAAKITALAKERLRKKEALNVDKRFKCNTGSKERREMRGRPRKAENRKTNEEGEVIFVEEKVRNPKKGKTNWPLNVTTDEEENCLMATSPYLVMTQEVREPVDKKKPILPTEDESRKESDGEVVPVPSWRVMEFSELKSRHIEEDLDDSAYVKMHAKLEIEERRRKRWDAQRQREEDYIRQLKENQARKAERYKKKRARANGRNGAFGLIDEDIPALFPDPKNAKYIRIEDNLPISCYGYLAPHTDKTRPWMSSTEPVDTIADKPPEPQPSTSKSAENGTEHGARITLAHSNRRFSVKPVKKNV